MASVQGDISRCINEFSMNVYKSSVLENPGENAFMSPCSIFVSMAMVHNGAKGNTSVQMTRALNLDLFKADDILTHMKDFVEILKKGKRGYTLSTANRLYTSKEKHILKSYVKEVEKYFKADVKQMDFKTQAEASRFEINKWIDKETNGKIANLLGEGTINRLTALVVVNAIYFKGSWKEKFDDKRTKKEKFYVDGKGSYVMVDMMTKIFKNFKYWECQRLSCSVLELPYKGEEVSMVLLLPDKVDGLPLLEEALTSEDLMYLTKSLYSQQLDVSLPKFKLESSYTLNEVLSKLGMVDLFNPEKADLSGMNQDEKDQLYVSHVAHKAFVDVNEEGTEAAAATTAFGLEVLCSKPIPKMFKADHPFLFMIWHKHMKVPLFIGRLAASPSGEPSSL